MCRATAKRSFVLAASRAAFFLPVLVLVVAVAVVPGAALFLPVLAFLVVVAVVPGAALFFTLPVPVAVEGVGVAALFFKLPVPVAVEGVGLAVAGEVGSGVGGVAGKQEQGFGTIADTSWVQSHGLLGAPRIT